MPTKSMDFRVLGIVYIVLYRKNVFNYIGYDVPFEPHKTRRWSHPRSRYTHLTTRGLGRGMVCEISVNTGLFSLEFCTHTIYIYINRSLHLQTNRACIACPVESDSLLIERRQRSWEPPGPRLTFHWASSICPAGL